MPTIRNPVARISLWPKRLDARKVVPMPDETKRIQANYGPFAGQQIDLPTEDADAAIADGWASDPFAPVDPKAEPPEFNQERHDAILVAAEKAGRKIRGEAEPGNDKPRKPAGKREKSDADAEDRAMEADKPGSGYETRRSGRPPKK